MFIIIDYYLLNLFMYMDIILEGLVSYKGHSHFRGILASLLATLKMSFSLFRSVLIRARGSTANIIVLTKQVASF